MGLFSSSAEDARKANLKALEDARLAFLPQIQNAGTLLMTLTERGSVRAIGFIGGAPHAIIAPELSFMRRMTLVTSFLTSETEMKTSLRRSCAT